MLRKGISLVLLFVAIILAVVSFSDIKYQKLVGQSILTEKLIKSDESKSELSELKTLNSDTIGILDMADIFLPVVKSRDNEDYLKKDFFGNESSSGCLFVSMLNSPELNDPNTVIYGHNMRLGTMFGSLKKYLTREYFAKNPLVSLITDSDKREYTILGAGYIEDGTKSYLPNPGAEQGMEAYLKEMESKFNIKRKVNYNDNSKILTLSTCTGIGENIRLILIAVLEKCHEI